MKYTMRSASVERIFFVLRKRQKRPQRPIETKRPREDSIKIARDFSQKISPSKE